MFKFHQLLKDCCGYNLVVKEVSVTTTLDIEIPVAYDLKVTTTRSLFIKKAEKMVRIIYHNENIWGVYICHVYYFYYYF